MDTPRPRPSLTDRALADKQAREAREAASLRANLLRRKQQQRARAAPLELPPERDPNAPPANPPKDDTADR